MDVIICDLDGTLCDIGHRLHLAKEKKWDEFHALLENDGIHEDVAHVIMGMPLHMKIIALTGRTEKYRDLTNKWLDKNEIVFDELIMRPDDDFTADHILKPRMLAEYFGSMEELKAHVIVILEDRDRVISAWRALNVPVWQCRLEGY
jgi:phosphoglycolate phosphatase-like HAD superfamily hydrolase